MNTRPRRELQVTQQWQQRTQGPRALGVSRTRVGTPLPSQHPPPSNIPGEDKYKSSIHAGAGLQPDDAGGGRMAGFSSQPDSLVPPAAIEHRVGPRDGQRECRGDSAGVFALQEVESWHEESLPPPPGTERRPGERAHRRPGRWGGHPQGRREVS